MNLVDLDRLSGLPHRFINDLSKNEDIFNRYDFLEEFEKHSSIHSLIVQIDDYCNRNMVVGFHYTRAVENDIIEKGLLIRTGKEIRKVFLNTYGYLFTEKELDTILKSWERGFDQQDEKVRDNRIYFNFTKNALNNGGAELLLKYYGGEQVYGPIYKLKGIGDKLSKIGIPLILKCKLNPKEIKTYTEFSWGKIAVSSYHRKINSNAFTFDQDGSQTNNVDAKNIETIKI